VQVWVAAGPACARKSELEGLPAQLTAGQAQALTVSARDACGSATAGGDAVEVLLDSAAEGRRRVPVTVRTHRMDHPILHVPCRLTAPCMHLMHAALLWQAVPM
jgi:hypothetical protein